MPRPRRDGAPSAAPRRLRLTDRFARTVAPHPVDRLLFWDAAAPGLALAVMPSGHRSWRFTYRAARRLRVFTIGRIEAIDLAEARARARDLLGQVARGTDPAAERDRGAKAETFEELATRYRTEHAMKKNRSWTQAAKLIDAHLMPKWAKTRAANITRTDVRAVMNALDTAPVLANQVKAAASAIFSWAISQEVGGITVNPCRGVEGNKTTSRERVASDAELPALWAALDGIGLARASALRAILLTGQRPGEVAHMRREHIDGEWWRMPGAPDPKVGWPGLKNGRSHDVWLTEPVRALIAEMGDGPTGFAFSPDGRGRRPVGDLDGAMRDVSATLGLAKPVRPHDLRRTHGTTVCALGFGRDAMNRIQNHIDGGIGSVYDRHTYADENRKIQEAVTAHVIALVGGGLPYTIRQETVRK